MTTITLIIIIVCLCVMTIITFVLARIQYKEGYLKGYEEGVKNERARQWNKNSDKEYNTHA